MALVSTPKGSGSGVIFRRQGFIITNWRVIDGYDEVDVTVGDDRTLIGLVIGYDAFLDLAIIKIGGGPWPFLEPSIETPTVGDGIVVLGFPSPEDTGVARGVITGFQEVNTVLRVQTDPVVVRRNSGGAVLNDLGQYIGVP